MDKEDNEDGMMTLRIGKRTRMTLSVVLVLHLGHFFKNM